MDMPSLPSMRLNKVHEQATAFAEMMVNQLDDFNKKHPSPSMSENALRYLRETSGELSSLTPVDLRRRFVEIFYGYIAAHYIILPDEEPLTCRY
jgi:hypothetical protein